MDCADKIEVADWFIRNDFVFFSDQFAVGRALLHGPVHGNAFPPARQPGPFPCAHCDQVLPSISKLESHMAHAHPELKNKPAVCDKCGKRYTYSYTLHRHRWKCLGLRRLQCDICGHISYRLDYHKGHLRRVHGIVE
ncbi:hypothetical protein BaRGS_00027470 [Batillaria attramentaria]|uniref:C2H2-type domain-containing protein n=1 Tax=Batillaria attramentaria TaxID=370345 RepID=A0ABD0K2Y0_9CAEN